MRRTRVLGEVRQSVGMKQSINRVLRRFGVELIPSWRLEQRDFSNHLAALFSACAIDCVLDVGANVGQYRDFLRLNVGYDGPIVSFEPVAANVATLEERAAGDPRWDIVPVALGERDGTADIHVARGSVFSSFLEKAADAVPEFRQRDEVAGVETVTLKRLDTVIGDIAAARDAKSLFLKMDTQGYDTKVVDGAAETLARVSALQSEVSFVPIYQGMESYRTSIPFLEALGFQVTGLFPGTRLDDLRVVEFDMTMRRV